MDNKNPQTDVDGDGELPTVEEALELLHELTDRYRSHGSLAEPFSAADRHVREVGHRLRFGCCAAAASAQSGAI